MNREEATGKRLSVIRAIVDRSGRIGKTGIQKIAYFLQEGLGVNLEYRFRMYHYGPYSDEIDGDLSLLQALGSINIAADVNGYGFHVTPGEQDPGSWPDSIEVSREDIDHVIDELKNLGTSNLELYATVHFVSKVESESSSRDVTTTVRSLKPKFSVAQIEVAYQDLMKNKLI